MKIAGWEFAADDARAARPERHAFLAHLAERCSADLSDLGAAATIYGELISNVIRHSQGPVRISVSWTNGYAVLRVRDSGAGFARPFGLPEAMSETGRGLFIVRELGRDVSIECKPSGCLVSVILPVVMAATHPAAGASLR